MRDRSETREYQKYEETYRSEERQRSEEYHRAQEAFRSSEFFRSEEGRMKEGGFRVTAGLLHTPTQYEALKKLPPEKSRLPMSPDQPSAGKEHPLRPSLDNSKMSLS